MNTRTNIQTNAKETYFETHPIRGREIIKSCFHDVDLANRLCGNGKNGMVKIFRLTRKKYYAYPEIIGRLFFHLPINFRCILHSTNFRPHLKMYSQKVWNYCIPLPALLFFVTAVPCSHGRTGEPNHHETGREKRVGIVSKLG